MNIEVTTVSKKEQKLSQAPAAIYVITQEDIRRSGMTSIPDLLRMVPGLQVTQIQGGAWAITARGFNDQYAHKLLVMVDGRSVYSPLDGGVTWEEQDTMLEDIERIEVIRGPGATLWGANAVNGIINIITKAAKDTQGALATAGVGDQGQALGAFRYGGQLGDNGFYRAFVKDLHGRGLSDAAGQPDIGGESSMTAGFRADVKLSGEDSLTVEAGALRDHADSQVASFALQPPFAIVSQGVERNNTADIMASWTHHQADGSIEGLRISYDHSGTSEPNFTRSYSNFNLEFQHQLNLSESSSLVWGLGFRDSTTDSAGNFSASETQPHGNDRLYSGFVQDQITLADGHVSFILGSKFEHNAFTGVEIEPGVRLLWTPDSHHTMWAAVSRAVSTPPKLDTDIVANASFPGPNGVPTVIRVLGDTSYGSEDLVAYELGYRLQTTRRFSIDLATFYNDYRHLATSEPGIPFFETDPAPAHLVIPTYFSNTMHGGTYGAEISSNWNVTSHWRLIPSYSWLKFDLRLAPGSHDTTSLADAGESPQHQFQIRSNLDISKRLQFDSALYYVSSLPTVDVSAYARVDARLGFRPRKDLEISLAGQNLQGGRHVEFVSTEGPYTRAAISRSVFVKLTWESAAR